ncbi:ABC transporter ATP-binding protein [Actinomycetaceae bacterium MB13-C1-2]|nr:ABC transporter ATP-binding protein [Actinomycetaceae bacterium MB13-C1-2]
MVTSSDEILADPQNVDSEENTSAKKRRPHALGGPSVVVDRVTKVYRSEASGPAAAKRATTMARALHKVGLHSYRTKVNAVDDVSLVVQAGEAVGILGSNGAGKSTLLRLIAGSEAVTSGQILARSQPTLLGVSAALVPALSGLRNIELGCLALGLTPEQTEAVTPRITELAGIGDAVERPMSTYSSGMGSRLRFAINVAASPDILLIDEALGTGDAAFATRSEQIVDEILRDSGTVFMVSHAAKTIENMCTRAVWMHHGKIIADGPAPEVAVRYRVWAWRVAHGKMDEADAILAEELKNSVEQHVVLDNADARPSRRAR